MIALRRISAAMPSRSITSPKWMPLAPMRENAIDFAASSVCLKASTVAMSGFGAPARTASPTPDWAISAALPATILPSPTSWSMAGRVMIATSAVAPWEIARSCALVDL